ncbi:glycosyltransferase [Solwaraspora sp. WMMD792]|uniref:glycosyltransferase n=1 Tax=Solwaraspora sp. WMMD792 TaxID=3016099 RepID=UPI002416A626|nr:glycosyltransferase [Solwaraspora sp. WMMD792]MDG4771397.1 glycosyltransferase [Solwaraspora sp. WMMD792]
MRTYHPVFVGRDPALRAPAGADVVSLATHGRAATFSYLLTRRSDRMVKEISDRGVRILHAHFGVEGVYSVQTARTLGVPLVTTLHGFDVTVTKRQLLASRKPSWINYVARRDSLFDTGVKFICVSGHIQRCAIEWGYPAERTLMLPIGVDTEVVTPVPLPETPRIVHVARLVEKKGTADLLRAFAVVRRAVPAAELVIIGDGPLRGPLGALATELGVAETARFLGVRPHAEVLATVAQSRVLCLPSVTAANGDQEGLGMALLEAAATGRPVVGTRHGGIPEAVVDGVTGYLVPERDPAALAERLVALLGDPDLCQRLGTGGRTLVEDRFDLSRQTAKLESLYRDLV